MQSGKLHIIPTESNHIRVTPAPSGFDMKSGVTAGNTTPTYDPHRESSKDPDAEDLPDGVFNRFVPPVCGSDARELHVVKVYAVVILFSFYPNKSYPLICLHLNSLRDLVNF